MSVCTLCCTLSTNKRKTFCCPIKPFIYLFIFCISMMFRLRISLWISGFPVWIPGFPYHILSLCTGHSLAEQEMTGPNFARRGSEQVSHACFLHIFLFQHYSTPKFTKNVNFIAKYERYFGIRHFMQDFSILLQLGIYLPKIPASTV